jgi:DNA-binding GntR family transcriptional regulator
MDTPRPLKRNKTSDAVIDYLLEALFEGRLLPGDRVDIDEVSEVLGVSRSPVREALVILERDGVVASRFHRGVYVEPFDGESILDDFEVYGILSGVAVARLARNQDPAVIADLQRILSELRATPPDQPERISDLVQEILRVEHRASGSRRLRAELRTFAGFLPWVFRVAGGRTHEKIVREQARVIRAIAAGDAERAARYRTEDVKAAGRDVVDELIRRGVFDEQGRPVGVRRGAGGG